MRILIGIMIIVIAYVVPFFMVNKAVDENSKVRGWFALITIILVVQTSTYIQTVNNRIGVNIKVTVATDQFINHSLELIKAKKYEELKKEWQVVDKQFVRTSGSLKAYDEVICPSSKRMKEMLEALKIEQEAKTKKLTEKSVK